MRAKIFTERKARILLTGTYYSDQWIETHLRPLAAARNVKLVQMVACRKGPEIEGVEYLIPSNWIQKILGEVPSRLLLFCIVAIRTRPDIVGGFHLLINGLVSLTLGKVIGASTLYICGGGAREVLGGGYLTENKIFKRIGVEDKNIENCLIEYVNYFDLVIVMGRGASNYFRQKGVTAPIYIQAGGFNAEKYYCADNNETCFDIIFIGRISRVKRIDIFVEMINMLKKTYIPNIKAVIVGDGPERPLAEHLVKEYRLEQNIHFAGWQSNVWDWLRDSKLFVLTSESEGLSQALIQAMMCGLPAVVFDVGDLSDLIVHHKNGYLIKDMDVESFVQVSAGLLMDNRKYAKFRSEAIIDSEKYKLNYAAKTWESLLGPHDVNGGHEK